MWMKIKALNIASKPLCCKRTQEVVNMWVLLGFWRQRSPPPPCSNSSRSMALDNWFLLNLFSVQRRKSPKQNKKVIKTMAKHFYRHTRQPMVHLKKIKNYNKTARCWNPLSSLSAAWKRKPLKIKMKNMTQVSLKIPPAFLYRLSTVSKLALVKLT